MAARPSMFFPPSASSSSLGDVSNKKSDPTMDNHNNPKKQLPVENPLLGRNMNHHHQYSVAAFRDASNDGDGLRQRHRPAAAVVTIIQDDRQQRARKSSNALPTPPPRTSYSLGTAAPESSMTMMMRTTTAAAEWNSSSKNTNNNVDVATTTTTSAATTSRALVVAALPSTRNCWVLVWGFTTQQQMERTLQFFESFGNVLDSRGCSFQPGSSNWFALQYENELLTSKAVAHSGTTTPLGTTSSSSSIYCGVKHLNDDDPIVMQRKNWKSTCSNSPLWKQGGGTGSIEQQQPNAANVPDKDSILLSGRSSGSSLPPQERKRSMCEQFIRIILLIRD